MKVRYVCDQFRREEKCFSPSSESGCSTCALMRSTSYCLGWTIFLCRAFASRVGARVRPRPRVAECLMRGTVLGHKPIVPRIKL